LNFKECKHVRVHRPEPVFNIAFGASITHFCVGCTFVHFFLIPRVS